MKKSLSLILSILLLFSFSFLVFANGKGEIYGETVTAKAGEEQLLFIRIKNNEGLMGFKIRLAYLSDCIEVLEVSRGDVTKKGNFNSNIGLKFGAVDVLWNNTEEISEDGVLFTVRIKVLKDEPFAIYTSFSAEDTFNEKYEDVFLICHEMYNELYYTEKMQEEVPVSEREETEPTEDMLEQTISTVVSNNKIDLSGSLSDKDKADFVNKVNAEIKKYYGKDNYYKNFNSVMDTYKNKLNNKFEDSLGDLDGEKTPESIIRDIMSEKNISKVNDENVQVILKELEEKGLDGKYANTFSENELKTMIKNILKNEKGKTPNKKTIITVIISATAIVITVLLSVIIIKKVKKGERRDEQKIDS